MWSYGMNLQCTTCTVSASLYQVKEELMIMIIISHYPVHILYFNYSLELFFKCQDAEINTSYCGVGHYIELQRTVNFFSREVQVIWWLALTNPCKSCNWRKLNNQRFSETRPGQFTNLLYLDAPFETATVYFFSALRFVFKNSQKS